MGTVTRIRTPTQEAIRAAGGIDTVAVALSVGRSAVAHWRHVPSKHLPRLATLAGMDAKVIRPDLYVVPTSAEPTRVTA